ncbi:MAG TPA: class I SAM-dependent methyltransferase, partial [Opitutaceae bacterium]
MNSLSSSMISPNPQPATPPPARITQLVRDLGGSDFLWIDGRQPGLLTLAQVSAQGAATAAGSAATLAELPLTDASCELAVEQGALARLADDQIVAGIAELFRVASRSVLVLVPNSRTRNRAWWESRFFTVGFRKHALYQAATPYATLEHEGDTLVLAFEKIAAAGLAKYPLSALEAERDLHNDMSRVSGRRSDAHIARYMLARQYLPKEGIIIDGACGLGYGSATLAHGHPGLEIVGLDCSDFAVDYGTATFSPLYPNVRFQAGDVCDLSAFADGSVSLVVSFETVEHLREPEKFLREVRRVLKPDGNFICSVPNLWVDDEGKDPNPWHFHVFDFAKITGLCAEYLSVRDVFNQTAGGGMKLGKAPRRIRRVNLPFTEGDDQAEWWLVAASREKIACAPVQPEAPADTVMVLTHDASHPLFTSWLKDCPHPVVYETAAGLDFRFPAHIGLVVGADCYREPRATLLRKAMEQGLPTLLLADGILEYRNTFEHPQIAPGVIFQPVVGHKVACLGRSHARALESWGNAPQCEIVGSARFDRYASLKKRARRADEPFRVLVMTAITPYFTPNHHERVRQALADLKDFFAANRALSGTPLQVEWRITKGLEAEVGVQSAVTDLSGRELSEVLQRVDAVISTPSTSMLEAMLLGLPVAVLDYCNAPHYVPAAWRITAAEQIQPTIAELIAPPAPKMLFQEGTLHDALECATPAAPRLLRLADEMLRRGQKAREAGVPLE